MTTPAAATLESESERKRTRTVALALIGAGTLARTGFLLVLSRERLDPDAGAYIDRAHEFSFAAPWAASSREPLWVAFVKSVVAPFDYSPLALRVLTTLMSVVVMVLAWRLFARLLPKSTALIALAFVALNGQLIFLAPRGVREETVMALLLLACWATIAWAREEGNPLWIAVPIGALCAIRWELGVVSFLLLTGYVTVRRRGGWSVAAVIGIVAVLMGPFFLANESRYGDPFYFSSIGPVFCRNVELKARGLPAPADSYGGPPISWAEFYLETLGPAESIRRELVGVPTLFVGTFYHSAMPFREARLTEMGAPPSVINVWQVMALVFVGIAVICIGIGLWRKQSRAIAGIAFTGALLGWALYATLVDCFIDEYRHVAFTIPLAGVAAASGAAFLIDRARGGSERGLTRRVRPSKP